ncbi:MAG: helix-turn-helix domain-containing protein [Patescibacteria group bacterium]|nr:helix-turn-helix domain-containing protein [Patescibacteria group bacterium]
MNEQLNKLLQQAGFTEKEASTYIALSELGSGTVTDISQRAKLKRSIVYLILEGLIKRGYVSSMPDSKINRYIAVDPTKIFNDLKDTVSNFKDALPAFLAIYNQSLWKPKINYFEGEGVTSVYRQIEHAKQALFISSIAPFEKYLPGEVENWFTFAKKQMHVLGNMHLLADTPADREFGRRLKGTKEQVRYLPKGMTMDMDISLFDNKVALTSLQDHIFIVVIESRALYNSMKTIFDLLWQQSVK